jgi:hypothetical protein
MGESTEKPPKLLNAFRLIHPGENSGRKSALRDSFVPVLIHNESGILGMHLQGF